MTSQGKEFQTSIEYVQQQYDCSVMHLYDGGLNSVAILSNGDESDRLVLKVPNDRPAWIHAAEDDEYRALNFLNRELAGVPLPI